MPHYVYSSPLLAMLFFLATPPHAQDAAALYKEAGDLQNAGKFAQARVKWQQFIKQYPQDAAVGLAYQGLGACSLETGDVEQAIDAFNVALKKLPEGESAHHLRWNLALAWQRRMEKSKDADHQKQLADALEHVLVDKQTPKDRFALASYYLGRLERTQGKTDAARKRFIALLDHGADAAVLSATRLALAGLAEDARDWPEAARRYADFLTLYPMEKSAGEARLGLAEAQFQQKQWKEAEANFAAIKSAKDAPGADYALFRWTELPALQGDLPEAAKRVTAFLEQRPKSPYRDRALQLAGSTFNKLDDHAKAIDAWEALLREFPKQAERADLRVQLGWALVKTGKFAQAEPHFKAALEQKMPAELRRTALWGWARCASGRKQPEEAARRFAELIKLGDAGADGDQPLYEAVVAAISARDVKTGVAWCDSMVDRYPKSAWTANAQLQTARALADQGDYDPALKRSRWVLDAPAKEAQAPALYLAGFCTLKARQFKDAIGYFEKLRNEHPKSEQAPIARYSLGVALESIGSNTKALAAYQDFLKLHPNHSLAAQAAKRVAILQGP